MEEIKEITMKDIVEILQLLVEKYKFNVDVLSRLLNVEKEVLLSKDEKKISDNFKDAHKIDLIFMLEIVGKDDADSKIAVFLQVLLDYHGITAETIALMSGENEKAVIGFVEDPKLVPLESKYKIAKTVMSLRFFLKELEP